MGAALHLWVAALYLGAVVVSLALEAPKDLFDCINADLEQSTPTRFKDWRDGKPSRLSLYKAWWSDRDRPSQLTVATALTLDRHEQLQALCQSWGGPISAAMYYPILAGGIDARLGPESRHWLENVSERAAALFHRAERHGPCQLDLMLLYEVVGEEAMVPLLPINTLRNYAIIQARTDLVLMLDVDMLVSTSFGNYTLSSKRMDSIRALCDHQSAIVLPALETALNSNLTQQHQLAQLVSGGSKEFVRRLWNSHHIFQFHAPYEAGHGAVNYTRWLSANKPYRMMCEGRLLKCEPYVVGARRHLPLYDTRFRGYGSNKVSHIANLRRLGFTMMVHPTSWIVHRDHARSAAKGKLLEDSKVSAAAKRLEEEVYGQLFADNEEYAGQWRNRRAGVRSWAAAPDDYAPVVDAGAGRCLQALPWWQPADVATPSTPGTPSQRVAAPTGVFRVHVGTSATLQQAAIFSGYGPLLSLYLVPLLLLASTLSPLRRCLMRSALMRRKPTYSRLAHMSAGLNAR